MSDCSRTRLKGQEPSVEAPGQEYVRSLETDLKGRHHFHDLML